MSTTSRTTTWYPTPPPPPPHFSRSRRTRRKNPYPTTHHHHHTNPLPLHQKYLSQKNKSEMPFDQQIHETPIVLLNSKKSAFLDDRREILEEYNDSGTEFDFLRMEREISLNKLERNRVKMKRTLRSAAHTLASGREKIVEGKSVNNTELEEEIEDLAEKLKELHKSSITTNDEIRNHFDKKACILEHHLEYDHEGGLSDHRCANESVKLPESRLLINTGCDTDKRSSISNSHIKNKALDMDLLRRKMEGLSNGILNRVEEEYDSMLFSTSNSSVATPASTSTSKRHDKLYQGQMLQEVNKCTGRCKAVVRRIVEQVRTESEQWSQMQEMVGQVRGEMEELQASRDFWESRAYNSDNQIQSLRHSVEVWKEKALRYDTKANELQLELSALREELLKSKEKTDQVRNKEAMLIPDMHWAPLRKQLQKEKLGLSSRFEEDLHVDENWCEFQNSVQDINTEDHKERTQAKDFQPLSLGRQLAEEKKTLLSHLKEDCYTSEGGGKQELVAKRRTRSYSISGVLLAKKRSPLGDIENLSPLARQYGRAALSFHSPESSRRMGSFRK